MSFLAVLLLQSGYSQAEPEGYEKAIYKGFVMSLARAGLGSACGMLIGTANGQSFSKSAIAGVVLACCDSLCDGIEKMIYKKDLKRQGIRSPELNYIEDYGFGQLIGAVVIMLTAGFIYKE